MENNILIKENKDLISELNTDDKINKDTNTNIDFKESGINNNVTPTIIKKKYLPVQIQQEDEISQMDIIKKAQHKTENIRNICVVAHVDHGKTSLVDSLISYNGIIDSRRAGQMRFMDSRPDEQERCITMKSSSISITYESKISNDEYLINIIDSPGHIDFSSEIFSALKICDGAIILIDVAEGICSQTEAVIKQAWDENIKCVLVLNKIDRLILELQLEPLEAYLHLNNLLEKANSLMGSLIVRDLNIKSNKNIEQNTINKNKEDDKTDITEDDENGINMDKLIEEKENELYFCPDKGNVIFASAIDNWAFTLNTFADILSKKIGFKLEALKKILWGDFYFNSKTKKVYTNAEQANTSKPMFVEFVLNNIYKLYNLVYNEKDEKKIASAALSIKATINSSDMKNPKDLLRSLMRQWLPIPPAVFEVIIEHLPNPIKGCLNKIDILFPDKSVHDEFPVIKQLKQCLATKDIYSNSKIQKDFEVPNVAFISKMVPLPRKNISGEIFVEMKNSNTMEQKDEIRFMPFARNYCGTFKKGEEYYVIGPKHNPKENNYDIHKFKFDNLYFFMGQYLVEIDEVPPGNIFSIGGLENYVYKTASISSVFESPAIIPTNINKNSIIKVSIISEDLKDMPKLVEGLKKLYKSDPAVGYYVQSNGEHILVTAGEVHLERCAKDLEDTLAKVKFKLSTPIVNFREGLANRNYNFRKDNKIEEKDKIKNKEGKLIVIKEKERKKDLNIGYVLDEGDEDINKDNQEEILKSSMPMVLSRAIKTKKPEDKTSKHKVSDFISIKDKTNFYLEKNISAKEDKKNKAYAEDVTPNRLCKIAVSSLGMTPELIAFLEKHEQLLKEVDKRNFKLNSGLNEEFLKFKIELLDLIENKRLKQLVENNLFCFGLNNCGQNMLIIKNVSKKNTYFGKINIDTDEEQDDVVEIGEETIQEDKNNSLNLEKNETKSDTKSISNKGSSSNKVSQKNSKINKKTSKPGMGIIIENNQDNNLTPCIEDEILSQLKEQITSKEFFNALKSGFELAVAAGPLSEEVMYGVIFIIEEVKLFSSKDLKDQNNEIGLAKEESKENAVNIAKDIVKTEEKLEKQKNEIVEELVQTKLEIIDTNENLVENSLTIDLINANNKILEEKVSDTNSISSKQFNLYGPFLGQLIGTVKDCCRKAFLNGDPRIYEAVYLCLFQIKQEIVGQIHSVISRRRGRIENEVSNDDNIITTIEAILPVVESFGFVEEIRKKSSGTANPMLQFHKWEIIDIDPFYIPVSQETLENFGANIDAPNLAKNYINKTRIRKGLPTDEKIIKNSDKQKNLSKKR